LNAEAKRQVADALTDIDVAGLRMGLIEDSSASWQRREALLSFPKDPEVAVTRRQAEFDDVADRIAAIMDTEESILAFVKDSQDVRRFRKFINERCLGRPN
jgi:isopropylmalate/homocitrate/citramalate synthase